MTRSPKWKRTLVSFIVVAPIMVFTLPETVAAQSECQQAQAWVAQRGGDLPATLAEVGSFPVAYQHAIFAALPAQAKVTLWHARLDQVASQPLTPRQRALVDQARTIVTPEIYVSRRVPRDWVERAMREFGIEAFASNFNELTDGHSSSFGLDERRGESPTQGKPCSCTLGSENEVCAWHRLNCCDIACSVTYGCGPFSTDPCNGICMSAACP